MIQPLKGVVLIEVIKEQENIGGVIVETSGTYFDKAKVLEVGPLVKDIKKGDTVYVHKIWEAISPRGKVGLVSQNDIFAKVFIDDEIENQIPGTIHNQGSSSDSKKNN